jgi:hypothetical protein
VNSVALLAEKRQELIQVKGDIKTEVVRRSLAQYMADGEREQKKLDEARARRNAELRGPQTRRHVLRQRLNRMAVLDASGLRPKRPWLYTFSETRLSFNFSEKSTVMD